MFKHKKLISAILAVAMLASVGTSVFAANGAMPFASDTTSNWANANNSYTVYVGPGKSCSYSGAFNANATSNCYMRLENKADGDIINELYNKGERFSGSKTSDTSTLWRGGVNWGEITIVV